MAYINKADGDMACLLSTFAGFLDDELKKPKSSMHKYAKKAKCIMSYCETIINDMLADIEPAQRNYLAKKMSAQQLVVTFKGDVRADKELSIVPSDALAALVNSESLYSPCLGCDMTGERAKKHCKWHDTLLALGCTGYKDNDRTDCPFKRGL